MAQTLDFDPPHMRSSLYQVQSSVVQQLCLLPVCFLLPVWQQSSASLRMTRWALVAPLLLLSVALGRASEEPTAAPGPASDGPPAEEDTDWGLNSFRGGLESVGGYFDSVLELMGGRDGVCQHRCRYGRLLLENEKCFIHYSQGRTWIPSDNVLFS